MNFVKNLPSIELCRELFDLSGWEYGIDVRVVPKSMGGVYKAPTYDLGYLVRKLPKKFLLEAEPWGGSSKKENWRIKTLQGAAEADTPEGAACKLAIELFKQGVLKRESEG